MKRSDGERVRICEQIRRMKALLDGLEMTMMMNVPTSEAAQAVADAGIRLATATGRLDAYQRVEEGR